jgi:hypothetical protein
LVFAQIERKEKMGFWNLKTLRLEEFRPAIFRVTPMVTVSAMNLLFPTPQKSEDLISIYSHGIHDFE